MTDSDGIKRTIPLFRDKTASQQQAAQLQKEIELAKAGVVDRYKEHRKRPLTEHLADFKQSLLDDGDTLKQVRLTIYRINSIFEGCRFTRWTDISGNAARRYLAGLRDGNRISKKTSNYYLKAIKHFCNWIVRERRASESPLAHLNCIRVEKHDLCRERRALEPDEIRHLLETTKAAGKRFGMEGYERALLYRLAAESGLRANEIRSLKISSFDFENHIVNVKSGCTKNKKEAILPLKPDTATELEEFFRGKLYNAKAFGGTYKRLTLKTADMLKADLADAGIPYVDDAGRYADFHSLRHTTGSLLAASGVHPKVAQSIMRHSDINLTMSRYTHTLTGQEAKAVADLPDLSLPSSKAQKSVATGTDNKPVDAPKELTPKLTPFLTPTAYSGCNQSATFGNEQDNLPKNGANDNCLNSSQLGTKKDSLSSAVVGKKEMGRGGFEPPTHGFSVRVSRL